MRTSSLSLVALLAALCPLAAGCGAETGGLISPIVGFYSGQTDGDGQGLIKFFVTVSGELTGNMLLIPLCDGEIHITGTVTPAGNVMFGGSGCGITFIGEGHIELIPATDKYRGSGTWTGSNGTDGIWFVTRQGATGAIGCPW